MLEIDGVKAAIEMSHDYERADRLSDIYYRVIDLATRPTLGAAGLVEAHGGRKALDNEYDFIMPQLEKTEYLYSESLTAAYTKTLGQVDELIAYSNLSRSSHG